MILCRVNIELVQDLAFWKIKFFKLKKSCPKKYKNLFHGKGKYTYGNGDEYEGDFEYGIRKGKGIYRKKGGFIFEGTWDNNVPNGFGKIIYNDTIVKCNFHNGNLIDNPIYETSGGSNDIDFNFYNEPMILSSLQLSHLENNDLLSSQYRAGARLSFLED